MEAASTGIRRRKRKHALKPASRSWLIVDRVQGGLIAALIIAAPWLFGCTERWSIQLMNSGCFAIGIIGLVRSLSLRSHALPESNFRERWLIRAFLTVNILLLVYCAIALLNARATFSVEERAFTYRDGVVPWLPTSYDSSRTGQFLMNSLAFFSAFWAIRFWIGQGHTSGGKQTGGLMNSRLKFILAIFVANGFLVAFQGLLQRLSGSQKLLWFRSPYWEQSTAHFGPFAYRGNAVDYLNLVWPVAFGFWYLLVRHRTQARRIADGPELLLLPMVLVTLGASFATASRGGVIVAAGLVLLLVAGFLFSKTRRFWKVTVTILLFLALTTAWALFGDALVARFELASNDHLSGRTEIYENARKMAADFPWFGTGPGTFLSVYHLYRESTSQGWAAFLHDDWMETRVTFGWVGYSLVLLQFLLLASWVIGSRARWLSAMFSYCLFLSILGCLLHAKVDFPFQTYGVVFTFVIVCVIITVANAQKFQPGSSADWVNASDGG